MRIKREMPVPTITRYYKHKIKPYTKKHVLEAMCMYSVWHYHKHSVFTPRSKLCTMRFDYGTQFLIDMFVLTEVYMNHFPTFKMDMLRSDIIFILNQAPNYRLRWEE